MKQRGTDRKFGWNFMILYIKIQDPMLRSHEMLTK